MNLKSLVFFLFYYFMNIQDVIEVFNNYYSKDNVYWDSINNNLIIHWDTIEIKNE